MNKNQAPFIVVANGTIVSSCDSFEQANGVVGKMQNLDYAVILIAEVISKFTRKVSYDEISLEREGVE